MVYFIVAFFNGFCNSINKMMNVKAGQVFGTAKGALINYVEATFLSLALILLTGNIGELAPAHITSVPFWVYLGSVCGLLAQILIIIGTLRTNVLVSSILTLVGNLSAALVMDYLLGLGDISLWKVAGIFLILTGTAWLEKVKNQEKEEPKEA